MRDLGYAIRGAGYGLRVAGHGLRVPGYVMREMFYRRDAEDAEKKIILLGDAHRALKTISRYPAGACFWPDFSSQKIRATKKQTLRALRLERLVGRISQSEA